jgi:endoglucanase
LKTLAAMALLLTALVEIAAPIARAQTEPPTPDALWAAYKQRFISAEGRLIDDSAGNVSHSEGQGYAMLLAAFAGDRATFDKLWAWTSSNLEIRGDGLAAWR